MQNNNDTQTLTQAPDLTTPTFAGEQIQQPTATSSLANTAEAQVWELKREKEKIGIRWTKAFWAIFSTCIVLLTAVLVYYLTSVSKPLGVIEGKVEQFITSTNERIERIQKQLDILEEKFNTFETTDKK